MPTAIDLMLFYAPDLAALVVFVIALMALARPRFRAPAIVLLCGGFLLLAINTAVALATMGFGEGGLFELMDIAGKGFIIGGVGALAVRWIFGRVLTTSLAQALGVLCGIAAVIVACVPFRETVAPPAHIVLVDSGNQPVPNACVRESWEYDGLQRRYNGGDMRGSQRGLADLPARTIRTTIAARVARVMLNESPRKAPTSSVGVFTTDTDGWIALSGRAESLGQGTIRIVMTPDRMAGHMMSHCETAAEHGVSD